MYSIQVVDNTIYLPLASKLLMKDIRNIEPSNNTADLHYTMLIWITYPSEPKFIEEHLL